MAKFHLEALAIVGDEQLNLFLRVGELDLNGPWARRAGRSFAAPPAK
jgi:hypothetical protein